MRVTEEGIKQANNLTSGLLQAVSVGQVFLSGSNSHHYIDLLKPKEPTFAVLNVGYNLLPVTLTFRCRTLNSEAISKAEKD